MEDILLRWKKNRFWCWTLSHVGLITIRGIVLCQKEVFLTKLIFPIINNLFLLLIVFTTEFRNSILKLWWKLKSCSWDFTPLMGQKKDIPSLEARLSETAKDRSSYLLWVLFVIATHKFSFSLWQHNRAAIEKQIY